MDRRSGTLLGMGIGLVVALSVFGITRLFGNNLEKQVRADVAQLSAPQANASPTLPPTDLSSPSPALGDSLLQRIGGNTPTTDALKIDELSETIVDVLDTR